MILDIVLTISTILSIASLFATLIMFVVYNNKSKNVEIELFPKEDTYLKNSNEDDGDAFLEEYVEYMNNIVTQKNRGSVRMGIGKCYTPSEYEAYREGVLSKELP